MHRLTRSGLSPPLTSAINIAIAFVRGCTDLRAPRVSEAEKSCHLALLASEFDRPNAADQKVRDAALNYGNRYFTEPGVVTRFDISAVREFLTRHGRSPDETPPAMQARPSDDGWVNVSERLPQFPAAATQVSVDVRHIIDDQVVEATACFVNEQSGLNPVGVPCFVPLGARIDLLNPHDKGSLVATRIEPTHWRPREA